MSLRTSDRRHWCGNPFSLEQTQIKVRRWGMRIPTPVCALARNDKRGVRIGSPQMSDDFTRSACLRGTEGYARIRKTTH